MAQSSEFPDFIHKAITNQIKAEIDARLPGILEEAKAKMDREIKASVDKIALSTLSQFSMVTGEREIVITVRKDI